MSNTKRAKNKAVYPKGLIRTKSKYNPNPKAKKNTQDFLKKTVATANKPTKNGIVVIPLIAATNKLNNTTVRSVIYFACKQKL